MAIPQHRIEYFKYKDTRVWDKSARRDLVFGSAGAEDNATCGGIVGIMNSIDDR